MFNNWNLAYNRFQKSDQNSYNLYMILITGTRFLVIFFISKLKIFIPKKLKCIDPLLSESSEEIRNFLQRKKKKTNTFAPRSLTRLLSSLNRKKL